MSETHTPHPDSHKFGLADNCPRCSEHARDPLKSLDDENLRKLIGRIYHDKEPRSTPEAIAMLNIRDAMGVCERLRKLASRGAKNA